MKRLILKTIFSAVILLGTTEMEGQAWNTVGSGIDTVGAYHTKSIMLNNELFVAEVYQDKQFNPILKMNKWDGLSWKPLPEVKLKSYYDLRDIETYKGNIYLGFDKVGFTQGHSDILMKWDGNQWDSVGTNWHGSIDNVKELEVYNGELIIGGDFSVTIAGQLYTGIMKYDGSNYSAMAAGFSGNFVIGMGVHQNDLYVTAFNSGYALHKLSSGNWTAPLNFTQGTSSTITIFSDFYTYSGNLYGNSFSELFHIDGDTSRFISSTPFKITDAEVYNNELYLAGDSATNFQPTYTGGIIRFDGQTVTSVLTPPRLRSLAVFQNELLAFSSTTIDYNGIKYNRAFRTDGNFSILQGIAFLDQNGDCFLNQNETHLTPIYVGFGGLGVTTSSDGNFAFSLPPGSYSLDTIFAMFALGKNFRLNCSLPNQISLGANQTVTQDIGISNNVSKDVQTFLTSWLGFRVRHGFTELYKLDFNNTGNATLPSGSVDVTLPQGAVFVSSTPLPSSQSGQVLTYDFLNVQPSESRRVVLRVKIDTTAFNLGDTIKFFANISGVNGDADLSDNADTLCQTVVGAFDPNDKQASTNQIAPGTQKIDYHIRFQNTGTDTAYKVTVVDTLDMTLPVTQIIINSASHPYNVSVVNNILVWEFDNIDLPDSGADYLGSQGFVRFSAGIDASLGVGDTIDNDAEIYFDYQPPVHTNHAKTAIIDNISLVENPMDEILVEVFPNPAEDVLTVRNLSDETKHFKLNDVSGRTVSEFMLEPHSDYFLKIAPLKQGAYFLRDSQSTFKILVQ